MTIPVSLAIAIYGIHENALFMIPVLCAMIPLLLTSISSGYDNQSNFEQFAFSMPIKKSHYVLSKLFFAFLFGIVGALCMLGLLTVKNQMDVGNILVLSLITFISSILLSAIQLPFVLKFGAEKGRLIMVITYFLIFALSSLLKDQAYFFATLMDLVSHQSIVILCLGMGGVSALLISLAIRISIRIMETKEY